MINNTNTIIEVYGIKGELILKDISSDTNISALFRRLDFGGVQLEIAHVVSHHFVILNIEFT